MMFVFQSLRCAIVVILVFLTMIMALGCATDQVSIPSEINNMEPDPGDPFAGFQQLHGEILAQVKKGTLPAAVGAKPNELKMELEKYLIKTEAELQILQLDVLYGAEEKREAALRKVVALAAERERTKMAYLQRLQTLNTSHLSSEKTQRTGKYKDIEIEIGPEDITEGERP